ncbi:MAG: glycosyltransferase [Spirochaetia bacterium]|nr:glycosyltransferase [Spirochaetia bacterium]
MVKNEKRNILYYTLLDFSDKTGQSQYAYHVFKALQSNKQFIIDLVAPRPKKNIVLKELLKNKNIKFHFLAPKKKRRNYLWFIRSIIISFFIVFFKVGKKTYLIYSLKPYMILPLIYRFIYSAKLFLLVEGLSKEDVKRVIKPKILAKLSNVIMEKNIKKAYKVYPAYQTAKEWVDSLRNDHSKVITCGADMSLFYPIIKKNSKKKNEKLTIGYIGSFRDVHLIREMLKAVLNMHVSVFLIGKGQLYNEIKDYLEKHIHKAEIDLLGELEQKEMSKIIDECDIMWGACDINHWGVPMKCFEYLSCNAKVIYTKNTDLSFIKKKGYGYELTSNNIEDIKKLIKKIESLYKNNNLKKNSDSREYISKHHSWKNFANQINSDMALVSRNKREF